MNKVGLRTIALCCINWGHDITINMPSLCWVAADNTLSYTMGGAGRVTDPIEHIGRLCPAPGPSLRTSTGLLLCYCRLTFFPSIFCYHPTILMHITSEFTLECMLACQFLK